MTENNESFDVLRRITEEIRVGALRTLALTQRLAMARIALNAGASGLVSKEEMTRLCKFTLAEISKHEENVKKEFNI